MGAAEVGALLSMFRALKREAERVRDMYEKESERKGLEAKRMFLDRIYNLCLRYNNAVSMFENIALKHKIRVVLESIEAPHIFTPEALDTIIINSDAAIGCLNNLMSPRLSDEERDKLSKLRKEVRDVMDFNVNLYKHIVAAIEAYEHEMFLAAALIAGKVICYVCDKLPGGNDKERASNLVKLGLIDRKLRDTFIDAARKARNYFTHDINAIADRSDALLLIAEACKFAKILKELKQPKNFNKYGSLRLSNSAIDTRIIIMD